MPMVEIHLPQPLFVLSNQCITQCSRLRVQLHFTDNAYNFGVSVSVLVNCYFAKREAKRKKEVEVRSPEKTANFQQADSVQGIRQTTLAT